jgi:hypothetical protein
MVALSTDRPNPRVFIELIAFPAWLLFLGQPKISRMEAHVVSQDFPRFSVRMKE